MCCLQHHMLTWWRSRMLSILPLPVLSSMAAAGHWQAHAVVARLLPACLLCCTAPAPLRFAAWVSLLPGLQHACVLLLFLLASAQSGPPANLLVEVGP